MAKDKLPYFKWYPKDFDHNEKVRLMNLEEIGLYALCLNHSWVNGSLPADLDEIGRAMKVPAKQLRRAWPRVAPCFVEIEGRLINPRQEDERAKAIEKSGKCTDAVQIRYGRKQGVTPRALARSESESVSESVSVVRGVSGGNPLYAGFEVFVQVWQKPCECCEMRFPCLKVDLGSQQWITLVDSGRITMETLEKITAGLMRYRASKDWHRDGGRYVPAVPRFLGWSADGRPSEPLWNDHPSPKGAYD